MIGWLLEYWEREDNKMMMEFWGLAYVTEGLQQRWEPNVEEVNFC